MPIYEYQCTKCEEKTEALQKISDEPLVKCPSCGKRGLKKLVSAASFRLKGGGWYETDFKTGNKKQLAESESASGNKSGKDAGNKSTGSSAKTSEKGSASKQASNTKSKDSKQAAK
jgi:putative FmdB family regulatory protein